MSTEVMRMHGVHNDQLTKSMSSYMHMYSDYYIASTLHHHLIQADKNMKYMYIDQPLLWAACLSKHSCSLMTGLYSSLLGHSK